MTDDTDETSGEQGSDGGSTIERGLGAYAASDVLTDIYDSLDVDALADGATFEEAVEYEEFGEALGRLIGHAAAKGASSNSLLRRVVKSQVASEVGGKAGRAAGAAFVEHGDTDALVKYLQLATSVEGLERLTAEFDGATDDTSTDTPTPEASDTPGPTDDVEWTAIEIEDGTDDSNDDGGPNADGDDTAT